MRASPTPPHASLTRGPLRVAVGTHRVVSHGIGAAQARDITRIEHHGPRRLVRLTWNASRFLLIAPPFIAPLGPLALSGTFEP